MKYMFVIAMAILVLVGAFFFLRSTPKTEEPVVEDAIPTIAYPTISSNVQVDLTAKSGGQAVVLAIKGIPTDTETVEYEITYTTAVGLPRGVLGKIVLKGESDITRDDIVLGTCSSGKCVYDTGVTSVNLTLKFTTSAGSSVFQKTYSL